MRVARVARYGCPSSRRGASPRGASPLFAQVAAGEITGVVKDQAGAAVPGRDRHRHQRRHEPAARRRVERRRRLHRAEPGAGRVPLDVELAGFKPVRREGIRLSTGEKARIDFDLAVGDVREQVTVTADAPILRAETASLGTVVEHEQVVQLPLNGRTFIMLAALAPGVALPPNSQLPRINGGRPRTNEYLFDGISVLQPEPGQVAFFPVIDAIQEFKIESNSPPAEFGRFNGGVVNLTTKAGTQRVSRQRLRVLPQRGAERAELLSVDEPGEAGLPAESVRRHARRTAGARTARSSSSTIRGSGSRSAARSISTVPTLLQRQGIFTEAIAGRVPVIYDPATTVGSTRTPFPGNTIPISAHGSGRAGAAAALPAADRRRAPRTTTAGPPTRSTTRISGTCASITSSRRTAIRLFGRLSYFRDGFVPVTPLPDGSGVTTGTLGPAGHDGVGVRVELSAHVLAQPAERAAHRRHAPHRRADRGAAARRRRAPRSAFPAFPSTAQFPNTLPTFLIGGYQQLGSPTNTASDFSTSVTEVADSLTWLKGRHTLKMGLDWRWERLERRSSRRRRPARSRSTRVGSDLPGVANTGTPLASFLLGQVQTFSIDLQQAQIQERAHFQEYFIQDDWKVSDRLTINPGLRYTLNFPSTEINGQTAVFNLQTQQLEYPGHESGAAAEEEQLRPAPGRASTGSPTRRSSAPGYGLVWIEMAGITTPFTTPTFPFLQTVSQRALDNISPAFVLQNGPSVAPIAPTPTAGLGQGVFAVDGTLGSGYVQQWNVSVQRELTTNTTVEVAYVGSNITHVGIPDSNLNQLTVEQLALGRGAHSAGAEPVLRHHPAVVVARRSDDSAWRSC